jgi:hypothetical protein
MNFFSSDNLNRGRNLTITGLFVVVALVIGVLAGTGNIDVSSFVNTEEVVSTEICVTPITGTYADSQICASEDALVSMGLLEREDNTVTVTTEDGVVISGLSNKVSTYLVSSTPVPTDEDDSDDGTQNEEIIDDETFEADDDDNNGDEIELDFSSFPSNVVPYRTTFMYEQDTHIKGFEFLTGEPGVRGVLTYAESNANDSAILIGPDTQWSLTTSTETIILTEDSYMYISGAGFTMDVCGKYEMTFDDFSIHNHEWQVALRGMNYTEGIDGNCPVTFTDYQDGAILVTRLNAPAGANGFLSSDWVQQQIDHAIGTNRGYETDVVSVFGLDTNDGGYALSYYQDGNWADEVFATNLNYRRLYSD